MREILNPWSNIDVYNCFGCSPNNAIGLRMRFFEENENDLMSDIVSVWQPRQEHQSWINTLHGGAQATLLDEVCGWVVFRKLHTSAVTAKMDLRYKKAVSTINGPLILRAHLKNTGSRLILVEATLADTNGEILTTCECTYFAFAEQKAKEMGYLEPQLSEQDLTLDEIIDMISKPTYRNLKL